MGLEKKKKSTLGIIGIIVIAIGLGSFFFFEVGGEPIKIGVILSETGPGSGIGIEERDGMLMAVDEINARGGINGRTIELIIVDSESNPEKAKKDFLEIEETHAPLMYVSSTSSISTAVGPLAEEREVVLMIFATASEITVDKQWVYRYFPMADDELLAILQGLNDLNIKNLGILYQNDEYGRDVSNEVATKFENSERLVSKESFELLELDVIDFKENIAKLQNEDAIYVVAFPDYIEIILKQLRESNYSGEILTPLDATVFKIINMPEANGVYLTAPIIYDSNFIFARTVSENFETRYNKQFDFNAANGYDLIRILGGLLQNEELSRDNVKRILDEGFIYSGVFGSIDVLPGEHDIAFGLYPSKLVDGKLEFRR